MCDALFRLISLPLQLMMSTTIAVVYPFYREASHQHDLDMKYRSEMDL